MNKVKITREQLDALSEALSHYGSPSYLVEIHYKMRTQEHEWTGKFEALNELTSYMVHNALKFGYEVVDDGDWTPNRLDKYGAEFKEEMLDFLDGFSQAHRLAALNAHKYHIKMLLPWVGYKTFNNLSTAEMADALGIEMDEQSSSPKPQKVHIAEVKRKMKDDETHLAPADYRSMIDLALATGDKAWFDELCSKLREGATQ